MSLQPRRPQGAGFFWSARFHIPIALPDGRKLTTLRDAGEYIQALPRAKHERPEWQVAVEMLIAAVEERGPLMFAEIAVRKHAIVVHVRTIEACSETMSRSPEMSAPGHQRRFDRTSTMSALPPNN
jgi:hypothetical protein